MTSAFFRDGSLDFKVYIFNNLELPRTFQLWHGRYVDGDKPRPRGGEWMSFFCAMSCLSVAPGGTTKEILAD